MTFVQAMIQYNTTHEKLLDLVKMLEGLIKGGLLLGGVGERAIEDTVLECYNELRSLLTRRETLLRLSPCLFWMEARQTYGLWQYRWRARFLMWRARRWIREDPKRGTEARPDGGEA